MQSAGSNIPMSPNLRKINLLKNHKNQFIDETYKNKHMGIIIINKVTVNLNNTQNPAS